MRTCRARRGDDRVSIRLAKPGNILADRGRQEFDILRHIADMASPIRSRPVMQIAAAQTHGTGSRLPGASQRLQERRLAGPIPAGDRNQLAAGC